MPEIPPDLLAACEQAYAEANERLDAILENVVGTIALRMKTWDMQDDSLHYMALRDFVVGRISMDGSLVTASILSAALFRLAHIPRVADPLEQMYSTKDKGSEQK